MSTSSLDEDYHPPSEVRREEVNSDVKNLVCSSFKSVLNCDKISYGKRKLSEVLDSSSELTGSALNVSTEDILLAPLPTQLAFTCSKLAKETLEQGQWHVKYVQS